MTAHRAVIAAASLTVMVAAALAAALAVFSGQALPRAVRHDLSVATGTQLVMSGSLNAAQAAQYDATLPGLIKTALRGAPFTLERAVRSDPLGFVPGALPAQPASAGNTPIAEAAGLQDITAQAVLIAGRWPGAPAAGQPIPAALPATAAALLHVADGDVLRMKDRITGGYVRFVITGLYRPRKVSAPYWALSDIASSGSSTAAGFTSYGPLTVQAAAFAGPLAVSAGSWLAEPRTASIPAGQLTTVAANVVGLRHALQEAQALAELTVGTSLPAVLNGVASNLDVARSLLAICAVLLFLLAAAALLAMARLLAAQREGETAMLVARGATRRQLVRLTLAEAIPLCALSAAAGGVLGVLLARLLTGAGGGGGAGSAWAPAAAIALTAAVIMVLPVLRTATPGMARVRRGRQAALSAVSRSGADLALVLLAVVAAWQLRHYSAASAGANGTFGVDPVVVIAPALALAGGTVLALRLLPLCGKAGDRLAARGRRLTAALASWQISRQPIRQGGAALLIVLAVATGTLTLAQRQSWTRSDHDQASFGTGADVRVEASQPLTPAQAGALAGLPGVRHAMPVATFPEPATGGETVAVDAGQAADVTLLRADQSPLRPAALFRAITPAGPGTGLTLPGRVTEVRLTLRLGPAALRLAPATVSVSVEDADSNVYELDAGTLPADGREHTLAVSLANQTVDAGATPAAAPAGAVYPLRLTGVGLSYTMPARRPDGPATFAVTSVSGGPGLPQISGAALRGWLAAASSAELEGVRQTLGTVGPSGLPTLSPASGAGPGASPGALTVRFSPGYGLAASEITGSPPSPVGGQLQVSPARPAVAIPGLATRGFLAANNASVGSTVQADINGVAVGVHIVGTMATFPTVSAGGGALVVDLGSVQAFLAGGAYQPAQATQWWLAAPAGPPPGLDGVLPPGSAVTSSAATAAGLTGNPLSTVPQQALLAIAIAAAVLAGTGFGVSIAAGLRLRRAENALLAALGVARRAAAGQLCLEKLMLSAPSALAGLALGAVLSELLVPAITLSPSATLPVPPVLIEFGWAQTLPLALAVAVFPILAAALTIARRPDAAAELRAAEAA